MSYLQTMRGQAFLLQASLRTRSYRLARLGRDSVIVPPATILSPHRIEIGDQVLVFERATFSVVEEYAGHRYEPRLRIGDRTVIAHTVWFSCVGEIEIGADVLIGHGVLIGDSFHQYGDRTRPILGQPMAAPHPVHIGSGASIGPGAAILAGTKLGRGTYVAAGAVVAGGVPPHSVVAGNPAEVIRHWDAERQTWISSDHPRWQRVLAALTA